MSLDKNIVKGWFVSRAKPFANQFAQWIDACVFKGEKIPSTDIDGLENYLGATVPPVTTILIVGASNYIIPAGYAIYKVYIVSALPTSISIGSLDNPVLYADGIDLSADEMVGITIDIIAQNEDKTIKFYGLADEINLKIFLHKI